MVEGTEIHVSRFKSPPRGGGPGDSAPSAPSTGDRDQDVPLLISPSPAGGRDPAVVYADEIGETREKELNGRDKNESPDGEAPEAPDASFLSVVKETPPFIKGGPTLKTGRRVILTAVKKPKSANSLNKEIKSRGRPRKSASTMSETSGARSGTKRLANAMGVTDEISDSPDKKKKKKREKAGENTSDKKNETDKNSVETGNIGDEWEDGEDVSAENNEPITSPRWKEETLLWIIEAQYSINKLISVTDNEDIKTLLRCFHPKEYRLEGSEKARTNITQQMKNWKDNGGMGEKKIVDAISFLGKVDRSNILDNYKSDELVTLLISEIIKRLPTKCVDCKNFYRLLHQ